MKLVKNTDGSELHRLRKMKPYDQDLFNRLYKTCRPLIKRLSRGVDARRYNLSSDIIVSYFWDKFLYVFNKYQGEYSEERLKATILSSLMMYKNKLLRKAYGDQADFNKSLTSMEVLYDNNKELLDDSDETRLKEGRSKIFHEYMQSHLSQDAYLVFKIQLDPPKWFEEKMANSHGKMSILHLIDYFDLPRDKASVNIISQIRKDIQATLEQAKIDLR